MYSVLICASIACSFAGQDSATSELPVSDPLPVILDDIDEEILRGHVDTLVSFHTRNTLSDVDSDTQGIGAARRWLEEEMGSFVEDSGGRLEVRTQSFKATMRSRRGNKEAEFVNVIGFLPGRQGDPNGRTYVVSGHYDSMVNDPFNPDAFAPGADDDASGTAVVLELARALSQHEYEANLVFLCAAGEEQGLYGSRHFANWAKETELQLDGMITNDIVGGIEGGNGVVDDLTLRVFSGGEGLHDPARELARRVEECARKHQTGSAVKLIYRMDRFGRGGDHKPFHENGVPAVRFTEANEHYARQHKQVAIIGGVQYGDLPEHVSEVYMARVARTNAALLAELALAPAPPTGVRLRAAMSYDTSISWQASPSENAAGYVVVWRDTTSPVWQHRSEVITETKVKLDGVIADNHFFGVQAVDSMGHASRTAIPVRPTP